MSCAQLFLLRRWKWRLHGTLCTQIERVGKWNSVLYSLFAVVFFSWYAQVLSYFIIIRLPFSSPHFCSIIWFTICTVCAHIVCFLNFPRQFKLHEHFIFFFHLSFVRSFVSFGKKCWWWLLFFLYSLAIRLSVIRHKVASLPSLKFIYTVLMIMYWINHYFSLL